MLSNLFFGVRLGLRETRWLVVGQSATWSFELTICSWRINWSTGTSRKLSGYGSVNKREGKDFLRGIYGGEKVLLWLQVAVSLDRRALPR